MSDSIKELLQAGIIQHSDSPFNENTVISSFYFPDIGEIFDKLGGNKFFSTLDVQKDYYQVKMSDKSIEKTAFSCRTL